MRLDDIGFVTITEQRAQRVAQGGNAPLTLLELMVTGACNFKCPYCRGPHPNLRQHHISRQEWQQVFDLLVTDKTYVVRITGGEATLHPDLVDMVRYARGKGVQHVALATNGYARRELYEQLLAAGVDEFSISLDAHTAAVGDAMAGGIPGAWERVVGTIEYLSQRAYVTVCIVVAEQNRADAVSTVMLAHRLGVSDIRVTTPAQDRTQARLELPAEVLLKYPILRYRMTGDRVRGLTAANTHRCHLCKDDVTVGGQWHWPCAVYMREGGRPIGRMGEDVRAQRERWCNEHDTHTDPICRKYCLDCMSAYNDRVEALLNEAQSAPTDKE